MKKKNNLPIIALVAIGAFLLFSQKPADKQGSVEKTTSQVFKDMKKAYGVVFSSASSEVLSKGLGTDRQLLEFVKPKIEQARKDSQKAFDSMCEESLPETFEGKEKEVADFLNRVARSW
jgi:hypothetical protein